MRKIALIVLLASLFLSCNNSDSSDEIISSDLINNPNTANENEQEKNKDNLPFFEFVEEVKDFGQITEGEVVSTSFRFKNVGKSNLIISSAQGSCGCTVPSYPKEPIKPSEEGVIEVTFNSNGKSGQQNKTITLVANTIPNTKVIALKGEVLTPKN